MLEINKNFKIRVCNALLVPMSSISDQYVILGICDSDVDSLNTRIDNAYVKYWGRVAMMDNGDYVILDRGIKLNTDKITLNALFKQSCINLNPVTEYRLDDYSRKIVEIIEARGEVPKELQLNL